MSRNSRADYTKYVHAYTDKQGRTRYAVAEWVEEAGQYQAPLDKRTAELTGMHTEFARKPEGLGGYLDRKKALRRARYLFRYLYGETDYDD